MAKEAIKKGVSILENSENKKLNIGIVGLWYGLNYGSILTYYALNRVLTDMGHNCLMLNKPIKMWPARYTDKSTIANKFIYKYCNVAEVCKNDEQLLQFNYICDTFVVGSDVVWNYPICGREAGHYFFLDFVNDKNKKIAYAASIGDGISGNETYDEKTKYYLSKFDSISVRESNAVDFIANKYRVKAQLVIDPVFLCDMNYYIQAIRDAEVEENEAYFATYFLGPDFIKKNAILVLKEKLHLNYRNLANPNRPIEYLQEKLGLELQRDVSVSDWLYYMSNCSYYIGDSYHGLCFAIIFKRPFIVMIDKNLPSRNRFDTLLSLLGLEDRMIFLDASADEINRLVDTPIDYDAVYHRLQPLKESSFKWLQQSLNSPKKKTIESASNSVAAKLPVNMCTGCSACVNACPVSAISLLPDEYGYYRSSVDYDRCTNCGLCSNICPAIQLPVKRNSESPSLYEFVAKDEDLLFKSSSGGVFSLLARESFNRGGCVAGAAWTDDFSVQHIIIESEEDMPKLRKSKYLQSYMGYTFKDIKHRLENGQFVLFSGCPCQTAGLKAYIKKDYENLLIIDILCGNAPSSKFFKKYLEDDFDVDISQVKSYEFRTKKQGWNADCLTLTLTSGEKILRRGIADDNYQRVYHSHVMCSQHCENCKYQEIPRFGDITIGDFWGVQDHDKNADYKRGISAVLINNEKGRAFFDCIPDEAIAVKKEVPLVWLGGNGFARKGAHNFASPARDDFYKVITHRSFSDSTNYALKPNHGIIADRKGTESLPALNYDVRALHFSFNMAYWEEHNINGVTVLIVKPGMAKPGRFATLPLNGCLERGKKYIINIKFMVNTSAKSISFYMKDSGSNAFHSIFTHEVGDTNNKWVEVQKEFVPVQSYFDQFMVAASQFTGQNAFLSIAYVNIIKQ